MSVTVLEPDAEPCPACGNRCPERHGRLGRMRWLRCRACHHWYGQGPDETDGRTTP